MAGSADTIGRLLATSVLRDGERQLLRNTGGERRQPDKAVTPPQTDGPKDKLPANSKAVAAVLLTLLDDQLATPQPGRSTQLTDVDTKDNSSTSAPNRLQARYSDEAGSNREQQPPFPESLAASPHNLYLAGGRAELLAQMHRVGLTTAPTALDEVDGKAAKGLGSGVALATARINRRMPPVLLLGASLILIALIGLLT